jgi:hypothetical protein
MTREDVFLPKHPAAPWIEVIARQGEGHSRQLDKEIAEALGWRVDNDPWWNWHQGPRFDPPGDEWCIRKDGRLDRPCNEALPRFTVEMLVEMMAA